MNHIVFVFRRLFLSFSILSSNLFGPQGYCPCCSMGQNFLSFYSWMIFLCRHTSLSVHPFFVDGHLSFHLSAVVNQAATNLGVQMSPVTSVSVLFGVHWEVGLPNRDGNFSFGFLRSHHTLSTTTAAFYVPNESGLKGSSEAFDQEGNTWSRSIWLVQGQRCSWGQDANYSFLTLWMLILNHNTQLEL